MALHICRICEETDNLKDLFTEENIAYKITKCADVIIDPDDHLPKYICDSCENNLQIAYQFKEQCEFTDRKWRVFTELGDDEKQYVIDNDVENDGDELIALECQRTKDLKEENETLIDEEYPYDVEGGQDDQQDSPEKALLLLFKEQEGKNLEKDEKCINQSDNDYDDEANDETLTIQEEYIVEDSLIEEIECQDSQNDYSEEEFSSMENIFERNEIVKSNVSRKIFVCDTCNGRFISYADFNNHKKTHGDERYQCPKCLKWFSRRFRLRNHLIIHEEDKKLFKCNKCDNTYSNQGNLDRHIRHFHKKLRPYVCTVCGLSFSRSHTFNVHQAVHTKERNFQCDICEKRFKAQYYLQVHKKTHLPKELRKKQTSSASRNQHKIERNSKSSSKSIKCQYCGKLSKTKGLHLSHVRMHTGEKPFVCKYCGKGFAFRPSLRVHEFVHTGEKPYKCKLCGLKFRQFGHLKGHNLIHSGIKNHKCEYCDKTFALKSNLVVHLRLHTGEQPYECNLCTKKFSDSNLLKRHKKQNHSDENSSQNIDANYENDDNKIASIQAQIPEQQQQYD